MGRGHSGGETRGCVCPVGPQRPGRVTQKDLVWSSGSSSSLLSLPVPVTPSPQARSREQSGRRPPGAGPPAPQQQHRRSGAGTEPLSPLLSLGALVYKHGEGAPPTRVFSAEERWGAGLCILRVTPPRRMAAAALQSTTGRGAEAMSPPSPSFSCLQRTMVGVAGRAGHCVAS